MIAVEQPTLFNAQCLVTKRADDKHGPYVDLMQEFDMSHQGRMYVSRAAVETMARTLGLPTLEDVESTHAQLADALEHIESLTGEVESLREFERAATYTVEHMGQKVRKKPGRPPKKEMSHAE